MANEKIVPNQLFKDGREVYEKGKTYTVPTEKAAYFRSAGWVGEIAEQTAEQSVSLDIKNVTHKASSKTRGGG